MHRQYVFPPDAIRNGVSLEVDAAAGKLRILTPDYIVTAPMSVAASGGNPEQSASGGR